MSTMLLDTKYESDAVGAQATVVLSMGDTQWRGFAEELSCSGDLGRAMLQYRRKRLLNEALFTTDKIPQNPKNRKFLILSRLKGSFSSAVIFAIAPLFFQTSCTETEGDGDPVLTQTNWCLDESWLVQELSNGETYYADCWYGCVENACALGGEGGGQ